LADLLRRSEQPVASIFVESAFPASSLFPLYAFFFFPWFEPFQPKVFTGFQSDGSFSKLPLRSQFNNRPSLELRSPRISTLPFHVLPPQCFPPFFLRTCLASRSRNTFSTCGVSFFFHPHHPISSVCRSRSVPALRDPAFAFSRPRLFCACGFAVEAFR